MLLLRRDTDSGVGYAQECLGAVEAMYSKALSPGQRFSYPGRWIGLTEMLDSVGRMEHT